MPISLHTRGTNLIAAGDLGNEVGSIRVRGSKISVFANHEYLNNFDNIFPHAANALETALTHVDPPGTESANGTRGTTVTDSDLSVWTLGSNGETLRNGAWLNSGQAVEYQYIDSVVQALGLNGIWSSFIGGVWIAQGTGDPSLPDPSTNHFRIPNDGASITDNLGQVWTLVGEIVHVNGANFNGWGNMLLWESDDSRVYHRSPSTGIWYAWNYSTLFWDPYGTDDPETGPAPQVLTLATAGTGSGTTSGGGTYATGVPVSLGAIPATGSEFAGWSPAPCATSFNMPGSPLTCTATFNTGAGGGGTGPLRSIITTGSINIASNPRVLTVSNSGIIVGDWVIVATGKEPGQGFMGTKGVGGTWPALTYATTSAMNADTTQAQNRFAWVEANGFVYSRVGSQWIRMNELDPGGIVYWNLVEPLALQAIVVSVVGNVVTLDRDAKVSVTNADVFVDMAHIISALPAGTVLQQGWFPVGGCNRRPDYLRGQGQTLTRLFSPDGTPSVMVESYAAGFWVEDITLQGNFKEKGGGMNRNTSTLAQFNQPVTEFGTPPVGRTPHAIALIGGGAADSHVENTTVIDCCTGAVWWQAKRVVLTDVLSLHTWGLHQYYQWDFHAVNDCDGSVVTRARVESPTMIPGFEAAFGAINVSFIDCSGRNASCAANGAGNFLYQDLNLRFDAGCSVPGKGALSSVEGVPACNINTAAGIQSAGLGGRHLRTTVTFDGPANGVSHLIGVGVGVSNPLITIDGLRFTATGGVAQAINSHGHHAILKNTVALCGDMAPLYGSYYSTILGADSRASDCTNNVAPSQAYWG